jgi:hypothetical protein
VRREVRHVNKALHAVQLVGQLVVLRFHRGAERGDLSLSSLSIRIII